MSEPNNEQARQRQREEGAKRIEKNLNDEVENRKSFEKECSPPSPAELLKAKAKPPDLDEGLRTKLQAAIDAREMALDLLLSETDGPPRPLSGPLPTAQQKRRRPDKRESYLATCRALHKLLTPIAEHDATAVQVRYLLERSLRGTLGEWREHVPMLRILMGGLRNLYRGADRGSAKEDAPTPPIDVWNDARCKWIVETIRRNGSMARKRLFSLAETARNAGKTNVPSESTMSHDLLPAMLNSKPPVLVKNGHHIYALAPDQQT